MEKISAKDITEYGYGITIESKRQGMFSKEDLVQYRFDTNRNRWRLAERLKKWTKLKYVIH